MKTPPLGYDDTNGTPEMTHPTDDELEAMATVMLSYAETCAASNLIALAKRLEEAAAMLRACKGRDGWNGVLEWTDDGVKTQLGWYTGRAHPDGEFSNLGLLRTTPEGTKLRRTYVATGPWADTATLEVAAKQDPAPDHTQWNAALRTFRQVLSAQTRNTCNGLSEFEAGIACDVARSLEKDHPHD